MMFMRSFYKDNYISNQKFSYECLVWTKYRNYSCKQSKSVALCCSTVNIMTITKRFQYDMTMKGILYSTKSDNVLDNCCSLFIPYWVIIYSVFCQRWIEDKTVELHTFGCIICAKRIIVGEDINNDYLSEIKKNLCWICHLMKK